MAGTGRFARASRKIQRAAKAVIQSSVYDTAVVLNYHSISHPQQMSDVLSVTPANFRAHMEIVAREFEPVTVASLRDSEGRMNVGPRRGKKRRVAVTFDDGYVDNLQHALPVLEEFNVPATVFIVSGGVGQTGIFWWDELEELVFERIRHEDLLASPRVPDGERDRRAIFEALVKHLKAAGPEAITETLADLRPRATIPSKRGQRSRALTLEELLRLQRSPVIDIGAHTVHHVSLGHSSREMQRDELLDSKRYLERVLDRTIDLLAYPFGDRADFNADTLELSQELGFRQSMTTIPGLVSPKTHPFAVPRMFVKNWSRAAFAQNVRRFFWTA